MAELILYRKDDATGNQIAAMAMAAQRFPTATIKDLSGDNEAAVASYISGLSDDTYEYIVVCGPLQDTHSQDGDLTTAQACDLVPKLLTASQGTLVEGTAATNADSEKIKIETADSLGVADGYNGYLIETTGTTAVARVILDDDGTDLLTVNDTTTAIDGETYDIFYTDYLMLCGPAQGNLGAAARCYEILYGDDQVPLWLGYLGGGADLFVKNGLTATAVAAGTISDTGEFTAGEYDGEDYYVAIISSTVAGEAGQIRKIASNTADVLTLTENWDVTPTGTLTYAIVDRNVRTLWDVYLKYATLTYLNSENEDVLAIWNELLVTQDLEKIYDYVEKGKHIAEAVWAGVVS